MANVLSRQIMEDGYRNAVVKVAGTIDTTDINIAPLITLNDFITNAPNGYLVGFRVDHVWHSMSNALELMLYWNAANPQQIVMLAGRGRESFYVVGGLQPVQTAMGYDGSINLVSYGFQTQPSPAQNQDFSLLIEMSKLYAQAPLANAA